MGEHPCIVVLIAPQCRNFPRKNSVASTWVLEAFLEEMVPGPILKGSKTGEGGRKVEWEGQTWKRGGMGRMELVIEVGWGQRRKSGVEGREAGEVWAGREGDVGGAGVFLVQSRC